VGAIDEHLGTLLEPRRSLRRLMAGAAATAQTIAAHPGCPNATRDWGYTRARCSTYGDAIAARCWSLRAGATAEARLDLPILRRTTTIYVRRNRVAPVAGAELGRSFAAAAFLIEGPLGGHAA
jgi:hypothetical protein